MIETEIVTSIITIVLGILAIFVFIRYRAGILFYLFAALTVIMGLANAWLIATVEERALEAAEAAKHTTPKRRKRRKTG